MSLLRDVAACSTPMTHLAICRECKRNILGTSEADIERVWSAFTPEKIKNGGVVCHGYKEK